MSVHLHLVVLAVILLFASIRLGESLTCFQCHSPAGGYCDDPLNLTNVTKQKCSGNANACLLLNETRPTSSEVRRECAHIDFCSQPQRRKRQVTFSRSCNTCSWSYCNSAESIAPTFAAAMAGLLLLKYCV